jgi:cholesterol transport system auxiliary component
MKLPLRVAAPIALAVALSACSLGGLMGGGKAPAMLLTLTPEAPLPEQIVRSANAGETVTIGVPVVAKELRAVRVPVQVSPTQVAYVTDLQWVDTPDRLFQGLLAETVRRTTGRVVLDSQQATLDPGLVVSGQLQRFGYDQASGNVIVRYDAAKSTAGGARVETRRFEARAPASGDAATVGPALNQTANQVALEVASWIGG